MSIARHRRRLVAPVVAGLVALAVAPAALGSGGGPRAAQPIGGIFLSLVAVANDDEYDITHDRTLVVSPDDGVLDNDVQLDLLGGDYAAVLVTDAARGDLDLRDDGGFTYIPDAGYVGPDSFRYKVVGALLESNAATVDIDVTNSSPVAVDDFYSAVTGIKLVVPAPGVLANDQDADGDSLTASLVDGGGNGSLDLNSDGSFTFKSGGSFTGTRTFTYQASDGVASSNTATVTITVSAPAATATPSPTPSPTPTPTPTPIIPLPTLPLPTLTPLPTLVPTPTPTPTPRATATPGSTARADATPTATPTSTPSPSAGTTATPAPRSGASSTPTPSGAATDAPGTGAGSAGGSNGGTGLGAAPGDRFLLPRVDPPGIDAIIDASFAGFGGIEWAVPAFALGVPGLLLMLAVAAQAIVGVAWLPFVRRWLGGLGVRRRARA